MNYPIVCSPEEIGVNFEKARKDAKLKDGELANAAGVDVATIGRWKRAEREPGLVAFARAVARMQSSVDAIVFQGATPEIPEDVFDANDRAHLNAMVKSLANLKRLSNRGEISIIQIYAESVMSTERIVREHRAAQGLDADRVEEEAGPIIVERGNVGNMKITTIQPISQGVNLGAKKASEE